MRVRHLVVAGAVAGLVSVVSVGVAAACGCFSPPVPVGEEEYAVNQQAEQIIFEVDPPWVTAHVLITYAGAPESFAWIVPVPEAPELGLTPATAFGLLDRETAPRVTVTADDLCPVSPWECRYHAPLSCGSSQDDWPSGVQDAASSDSGGPGVGPPPVVVIDEQVVGDYQTVTFSAAEASAAVQWLNDNGFIVNDTTAPYMQPYVEANMVFVAAKLVPGADTSGIRPLRMRFRSAFPMIPLILTSVASEPHLTVTAYLYGTTSFRPIGHPLVPIDARRLARDGDGRLNYPMVLSRTIDEAGGDAFVAEYRGYPALPQFGQGTGCCGSPWDSCGVGGNGQCECPGDMFEGDDCSPELIEGLDLLADLASRHSALTRITTRLSPEEMRFDPTFEPDYQASQFGPLRLGAVQATLDGCADRVIDRARYAELDAMQGCAAVYCGTGECAVTPAGAGCDCDAGSVARRFTDLDGLPSVTCVPATSPIDLAAGGLVLPDACTGVDCGLGTCLDINGVAHCACDGGAAAAVGPGSTPLCAPIDDLSRTPGADDFSEPLRDLQVCRPRPPTCREGGWLELGDATNTGVDCGDSEPDPSLTKVPPEPHCGGIYGCGGCSSTEPVGAAIGAGLLVGFLARRRRRRPA